MLPPWVLRDTGAVWGGHGRICSCFQKLRLQIRMRLQSPSPKVTEHARNAGSDTGSGCLREGQGNGGDFSELSEDSNEGKEVYPPFIS